MGYYLYNPNFHTHGFSQSVGQALYLGVPLLVIAGLSWFWPAPGGITGLIIQMWPLNFWLIFLVTAFAPHRPAYYLAPYAIVYGLFLVGAILHLVVGLGQRVTYRQSKAGTWLRWAARIVTFACLVTYSFIPPFFGHLGSWGYEGSTAVAALIGFWVLTGIAWVWSAPGGILIMLFSIMGFQAIPGVRDIERERLLFILYGIFLAGGILHLISAWLRRGRELK